jgi:hypothetical protein
VKTSKLLASLSLLVGTIVMTLDLEPASADTPDLWRNRGTGHCLYYNGEPGQPGNVHPTPGWGDCRLVNHQWHVHRVSGTPYYRLVSTVGGACLTGYSNGTLRALGCNATLGAQLWEVTPWANGRYTLKSVPFRTCVSEITVTSSFTLASCPGGNAYQEWTKD